MGFNSAFKGLKKHFTFFTLLGWSFLHFEYMSCFQWPRLKQEKRSEQTGPAEINAIDDSYTFELSTDAAPV